MFDRTLPLAETTRFSLTDARNAVGDSQDAIMPSTFTSTLSPSLLTDLKRFADESGSTDLLPVMAASVRHGKPLSLHLEHRSGFLKLSVFPRDQLFYCAEDIRAMASSELSRLRLIHVEPGAPLVPSGGDGTRANPFRFGPLAPLLWALAVYGDRSELLPEIAGSVRYRLAPGISLQALPIEKSAMPLLQRLRGTASSLEELAVLSILGQGPVKRLLNALYLQSGLIVSRASPRPARDAAPTAGSAS